MTLLNIVGVNRVQLLGAYSPRGVPVAVTTGPKLIVLSLNCRIPTPFKVVIPKFEFPEELSVTKYELPLFVMVKFVEGAAKLAVFVALLLPLITSFGDWI